MLQKLMSLFSRSFSLFLAWFGAVCLMVAAFMVYVPAGFAVLGFVCLVAAYLRRALEVMNEVS